MKELEEVIRELRGQLDERDRALDQSRAIQAQCLALDEIKSHKIDRLEKEVASWKALQEELQKRLAGHDKRNRDKDPKSQLLGWGYSSDYAETILARLPFGWSELRVVESIMENPKLLCSDVGGSDFWLE